MEPDGGGRETLLINKRSTGTGLKKRKYGGYDNVDDKVYKDWIFSFLFIAIYFMITVYGYSFGIKTLNSSKPLELEVSQLKEINDDGTANWKSIFLNGVFIILFLSISLSIGIIILMTHFAKHIVTLTFATTSICCIMLGIILFTIGNIAIGLVLMIFAIISYFTFTYMKPRIAFASINLKIACQSIQDNMPALIGCAILMSLFQLYLSIIWILTVIGFATNESINTISYNGKYYNFNDCSNYHYSSIYYLPDGQSLACTKTNAECSSCVCSTSNGKSESPLELVIISQTTSCFEPSLNISTYACLLLAFIWMCIVCANVVHYTVAGAVSIWWCTGPGSNHGSETEAQAQDIDEDIESFNHNHHHPQHRRTSHYISKSLCGCFMLSGWETVKKSFVRSLTTSFGTICLGSLIVAIVRFLRTVLKVSTVQLKQMQSKDTSRSTTSRMSKYNKIFLNFLEFLLSILDRVMEYCNMYAFCFSAMYGYNFIDSSRAAVNLFGKLGWTTIVNDDIIDSVLFFCHVLVGVLCSLTAGLYYQVHINSLGHVNGLLLILLGYFSGHWTCNIVLKVISSAVATIYVNFAERPELFKASNPELFAELLDAWTKVYPKEVPKIIMDTGGKRRAMSEEEEKEEEKEEELNYDDDDYASKDNAPLIAYIPPTVPVPVPIPAPSPFSMGSQLLNAFIRGSGGHGQDQSQGQGGIQLECKSSDNFSGNKISGKY